MTPLAIAVVSSAAYVGSGAAQFKNGAWIIAGIGDHQYDDYCSNCSFIYSTY